MLDYEFGEHIGQGGMADVYMGFQRGLGGFEKLVVLKQILPTYAENAVFRSMFVNEARLAAAIRHPNVVETYDIHQSDDRLFIAMEYIDGLSLLEVLKSLGNTQEPIVIAARIIADLSAGVHAAHNLTSPDGTITPIVHLDITPSNLMVTKNGIAKILDYGIAKAANGSEKKSEFSGGKPGYIPPEYTKNGIVDTRGDIFQLGLVLHELLTGKLLFDGGSPTAAIEASETSPIIAPSAWRPEIPKVLDDIVLACLERDLEKRTASAKLLRQQLTTFLKSRGNPSSAEVAYWLQSQCYSNLESKKVVETRVRRESEMMRMARGTNSDSNEMFTSIRYDNPTRSLRSKSELQHLILQEKPLTKSATVVTETTRAKTPFISILSLILSAVGLCIVVGYLAYNTISAPLPTSASEAGNDSQKPILNAASSNTGEATLKPTPTNLVKPIDINTRGASKKSATTSPKAGRVNAAQAKRTNKKQKRRLQKKHPETKETSTQKEKTPKTDLHDPWASISN